MAQENQSGMKGKLGHVGETIKEKVTMRDSKFQIQFRKIKISLSMSLGA